MKERKKERFRWRDLEKKEGEGRTVREMKERKVSNESETINLLISTNNFSTFVACNALVSQNIASTSFAYCSPLVYSI